MKIKTVLASEKKLMIQGLNQLLNKREKIEVIDLASNYGEIIYHIDNNEPDIIIIYIGLAKLLSEERKLREICINTKVLLLVERNDINELNPLLIEGIAGVVSVVRGVADLENAILSTYQKNVLYTMDEIDAIAENYLEFIKHKKSLIKDYNLTTSQLEILRLVATGKKNIEIAKELLISIYTVEIHRKKIMCKMNVKNSFQMIKNAISLGII